MKWLVLATLIMTTVMDPGFARAKGKILFFDLEAPAASRSVAKRINASLRSWVSSSDGLSSQYGQSLAEARRLHCKTVVLKRSFHDCLARIGRSLGADRLVIGSVLPSGKNYRIVLTIVDTHKPKNVRTITENLLATSTQGTALESWIRRWFKQLFTAGPGFLIVSCNLDSVFVRVDRKRAGFCGQGVTRLKLSGGKHRVSFARAGYVRLVHWVKVRRGENTRLKVTLRRPVPVPARVVPRPGAKQARTTPAGVTPPPPTTLRRPNQTLWRVLFFGTLGTGAALLVASIVTSFKLRSLEEEKTEILINAMNNPPPEGYDFTGNVCENHNNVVELVDVCNRGARMSQLTNVFIGVGASLVFTSALFMYFGYFAKAKRVSDTALNHPTTSVTVTPQVYKGGGGLLTTLRF